MQLVERLDIQPGDRVLEIGFGTGYGIALAAARTGDDGLVVGVDHSEVMLRQATRRNAGAIREKRVAKYPLRGRGEEKRAEFHPFTAAVNDFLRFREPFTAAANNFLRSWEPFPAAANDC